MDKRWMRVYGARLLKLARHLEKGKLGHKKFDFSVGNVFGDSVKRVPYKCGTSGCAIGECPILFPRDWHFSREGAPKLRKETSDAPLDWYVMESSAISYFDLSEDEVAHLFVPEGQTTEIYGGTLLMEGATPKEVAKNIRAFVKLKAAQQ